MKVQVFHIRLTKENLVADQEKLNDFLEKVTVKKTAIELVQGQTNFWSIVVFYELANATTDKSSKNDKISFAADTPLTDEETKIVDILRQWRTDKANELGLPAYMICTNADLTTIAKVKPRSIEDLINIKGFAGQKISKFGSDIIAALNSV